MAGGLSLAPEAVAPVVACAAMLGTAVWLLRVKASSRLHRAFALYLAVRGLLNLAQAFLSQGGPSWGLLLIPPVLITIPFVTLYFAWVYRATYLGRSAPARRGVPAALLLGALAVEAAYFAEPARFFTLGPGGLEGVGPLFAFLGLTLLSYGAVGLMMGRDHLAGPATPMRRSLHFAAVGFALEPLFLGTHAFLHAEVLDTPLWMGIPTSGWALWSLRLITAGAALSLLLLVLFGIHAVASRDPLQRRAARRSSAALMGALASAVGAAALQPYAPSTAQDLAFVLDGFWVVALPLLVGYGLARHQLFDLDLRARRTVRQATLVGALLLVFAVGGLAADLAIQGPALGWGAGAAAMGLFVLALPWLRGAAERVARAAVPAEGEDSAFLYRRKLEVYAANLEEALADGTLTAREQTFLARLRDGLGITPQEHDLIEHMVRRRAGRGGGSTLRTGLAVGKYEVLKPLKDGAFGQALLARDVRLDRPVVIKSILPALRGDPKMREAFLREARILAHFDHPHLVTVHEVEASGEDVYIVMEHCRHGTLQDLLLRRGVLPLDEVARIGDEALRGLEAAHAAGVVHRDLKPSNLFLAGDGRVKIGDFGIAHAVAPSDTALRLTLTGTQPGTLQYMSPEQVEGKDLDPRSDLYSLAATLYRAATGQHYLDLKRLGDFEMRRRIVHEPPRLPAPGLPDAFNAFLARALAKRPEERHPSAAQMRLALLRATGGTARPAAATAKAATFEVLAPGHATRPQPDEEPSTGLAGERKPGVNTPHGS